MRQKGLTFGQCPGNPFLAHASVRQEWPKHTVELGFTMHGRIVAYCTACQQIFYDSEHPRNG